jgi:hypothetical protein
MAKHPTLYLSLLQQIWYRGTPERGRPDHIKDFQVVERKRSWGIPADTKY